jgi:prepilin-type N-terminal cleavage/methylation domain-containing protein
MNKTRRAFTLIEILVTIVLLGLIVPALFESVTLLQRSNRQLAHHLSQNVTTNRIYRALFEDIAASTGKITLHHDTFDAVCIEATEHSLYGMSLPSVCWAVLKRKNRLVRIEGEALNYPLHLADNTKTLYADIFFPVKKFVVTKNKDDFFVAIERNEKDFVAFVVQAVSEAKGRKKKKDTTPSETPKTAAEESKNDQLY